MSFLIDVPHLLQVFCNPEAQMGFHPDAGASYYLSHLPGYLGNIYVENWRFSAFIRIQVQDQLSREFHSPPVFFVSFLQENTWLLQGTSLMVWR